jgi:diguanylate cyclase (GGDEF)-like protein
LNGAELYHFSLSLSNIKLRETLHNQSINDPLTGLFNRRYMEETLDRELLRARRKNSHIGLIMLDIDHFKKFNDTYGHASGDLVLTSMANLLKSQVRSEDIICRLGGEEFQVILQESIQEITCQRAKSFREGVQVLKLEYVGQSLGSISVSQGVAAFPEKCSIRDVLLQKADEALYLAKNNGRNRVEVIPSRIAGEGS